MIGSVPTSLKTADSGNEPASDELAVRWAGLFPELVETRAIDELTVAISGRTLREYALAPSEATDRRQLFGLPEGPEPITTGDEELPFADFLQATVRSTIDQYASEFRTFSVLYDASAFVDKLLSDLTVRLFGVALRTLIRELHALRDSSELSGDTPEARFDSFCAKLRDEQYVVELWRRFPGLLTQLHETTRQFLSFAIKIVRESESQAQLLETEFPELTAGSRLVEVDFGNGDRHKDGESVSILTFDSGVKLVFKPRPMEMDYGYQILLSRINAAMGSDLATVRVVVGDGCGWMEFVSHDQLDGGSAQEDYYRQVGQLTAILFLLSATDIHHENIISSANRPVVVDLETLFSSPLRSEGSYAEGSAAYEAATKLATSVCSIGILPTIMSAGKDLDDLDMGGVGFEAGQLSPLRSFAIHERGTDQMHVSFERLALTQNPTVPPLDRASVQVVLDNILEGFGSVFAWLTEAKATLLDWVGELFASVQLRHIHSPTYFYGQLLRMSTHPDFMMGDEGRRVLFHRVGLLQPDANVEITRAEYRDLLAGDVPYFIGKTDTRELSHWNGASLGQLFAVTPLDWVTSRISAADDREMQFQSHLISMTFTNKLDPETDQSRFEPPTPGKSVPKSRDSKLIDLAKGVGDELLSSMFKSRDAEYSAAWIGPLVSSSTSRLWRPGVLAHDIYGGTAGIALFLAALGKVSGDDEYGEAAALILNPLVGLLDADLLAQPGFNVGAYGGAAGAVYSIVRCAQLMGNDVLVSSGMGKLRLLDRMLPFDTQLDVMAGSSGALLTALSLFDTTSVPAERTACLEIATSAYQHLRRLHPALNAGSQEPTYSGFAHGLAGVIPGLLKLAAITNLETAHADGMRLLEAQERMFDSGDRDWSRSNAASERSYGWCHGSPGILLGLLLSAESAPSLAGQLQGRISDAVGTTWKHGFGNNITYCHGDIGNIEILHFAAQVTGDTAMLRRVESTYSALFSGVASEFLTTRKNKYSYSNSLLVGKTGVAYAILRSLASDEIPSFLRLQ